MKYINFILIVLSLSCGVFSIYMVFFEKPWESQWKINQEKYDEYHSNFKSSEENIKNEIILLQEVKKKVLKNEKDILENHNKASLNSREIASLSDIDYEDLLLMEIQYLLNMANQKILISKDYTTAAYILNDIDKILSSQNNPKFVQLISLIEKDRLILSKVEEFDLNGTLLRLSSLEKEINNLPIIKKIEPLIPKKSVLIEKSTDDLFSTKKVKELLLDTWSEFKTLIVIRKISEPIRPLLSDHQYLSLKNNINLLLNQAQIFLININPVSYKNALNQLRVLIKQYFPNNDPLVRNFLKEVSLLEKVDFDLFNIDVNSSLKELRKIKNTPNEKSNNINNTNFIKSNS